MNATAQKRRYLAYSLLLLSICFQSCLPKEEEDNPTPDTPILNTDTLVLKPGRGFSQLVIAPWAFDGSAGVFPAGDDISPADISLDENGQQLHFAVRSTITSQQDPIVSLSRRSLDLNNNTLVEKIFSDLPLEVQHGGKFQQGTDKFYLGKITVSNFGIGTSSILGDFTYSRTNTFATMPRVTAEGEIMENGRSDNFASWAPTWGERIFGAYKMKNGQRLEFQTSKIVPNRDAAIYAVYFEPKAENSPTVWFFGASTKKLYVGLATMSSSPTVTTIQYVDSVDFPSDFATGYNMAITARASADRKKFGLLVNNQEAQRKFYTFSFDAVTQKLAVNIANKAIPGLGDSNVDYDIDEAGNIYFDGWANNFQSDSTIAIYKASGNSIVSVGEDLIKSGSIKCIRYLNGKIYACVAYSFRKNLTSPNAILYRRVALIRQD